MGTISNRDSESADSGIWIAIAPRKIRHFMGFFNQQGIYLTEYDLVNIVDEIRKTGYRPVRRVNHNTQEFTYWIGVTRILIRVTVKGGIDNPEGNLKWIVSRIVIHNARQEVKGNKQTWPQRRNPIASYCHS